ncbi:MAG: hypothetical protein H7836_00450 [Magnetococcus sp. YQC-3]
MPKSPDRLRRMLRTPKQNRLRLFLKSNSKIPGLCPGPARGVTPLDPAKHFTIQIKSVELLVGIATPLVQR